MLLSEVAASLYAWDLADEGAPRVMDALQERCMANSFYLVGVMHHEKRPLTSLFFTHNPKRKYYIPENSCTYYRMDPAAFRDLRLKPCHTQRDFLKGVDWLDVLTAEARKRHLKTGVELSHTLFDTDIAAEQYPEMMQQDCYGHTHQGFLGMLCSNHPEVREFQKRMFVETIRNHDIDFIQTCLITFYPGKPASAPWFSQGWMQNKKPALADLLGVANGGCFCPSCQAAAKRMGYDWDLILRDMRKLHDIVNATVLQKQELVMENHLLLTGSATEGQLFMESPGLMEFLKFRVDCVTELFKEVSEMIHSAQPGIDFRYNNFVHVAEHAGLSFKRIAPYVDSVRDCEYSEHFQAPDRFLFKRQNLLEIRRGIGFDKKLIAAIACRPNASPQILYDSLSALSEVGIDGISLGHYDCAHYEHLNAIGEGLRRVCAEIDPSEQK